MKLQKNEYDCNARENTVPTSQTCRGICSVLRNREIFAKEISSYSAQS